MTSIVLNLPQRPGRNPRAFDDFSQVSDQIIHEWIRRKKLEGLSPYESANGFLKREAYRVICHYVEHGAARFFERVIRSDGGALSSVVKLDENPFHYGLGAMFIDEPGGVLTRHERSLFSTQMVYAYRHNVSPELLIGFIYQCGSNGELRRKVRGQIIEHGFEDRYRSTFGI